MVADFAIYGLALQSAYNIGQTFGEWAGDAFAPPPPLEPYYDVLPTGGLELGEGLFFDPDDFEGSVGVFPYEVFDDSDTRWYFAPGSVTPGEPHYDDDFQGPMYDYIAAHIPGMVWYEPQAAPGRGISNNWDIWIRYQHAYDTGVGKGLVSGTHTYWRKPGLTRTVYPVYVPGVHVYPRFVVEPQPRPRPWRRTNDYDPGVERGPVRSTRPVERPSPLPAEHPVPETPPDVELLPPPFPGMWPWPPPAVEPSPTAGRTPPRASRPGPRPSPRPGPWSPGEPGGPPKGGPKPPGKNTKERKMKVKNRFGKSLAFIVRHAVNTPTEVLDFINAMYFAIPVQYRPGYYPLHRRDGSVFYKKRWNASLVQRIRTVYRHYDKIHPADLLQNLAGNQAGDRAGGHLGRLARDAARKSPISRPVSLLAGPWDSFTSNLFHGS